MQLVVKVVVQYLVESDFFRSNLLTRDLNWSQVAKQHNLIPTLTGLIGSS